MRRELLLTLTLLALLCTGCGSLDDWSGLKRRKMEPPPPVIDDGQIAAQYLSTLDRLGRGGAAEQAEILEATRSAFLAEPTTRNRLNYAFVLAVPGHSGADPEEARILLGEALATPETLLSPERALAAMIVRDLDVRLALAQENAALRADKTTDDRDRIANLNRRLQQEMAEKERLRRELEEAKAKLDAIATLEGGASGRKP